MKTIKVSEATGPALDWLVAKCEGYTEYDPETDKLLPPRKECGWVSLFDLNYSTDPAQAYPIIYREEIGVKRNAPCSRGREWEASPSITAKGAGGRWGYGPTPLIAAMRCYVASKLGEEVEVPEELVCPNT